MWVQSLGQEDQLEESMATHASVLAQRIPQTEKPGGLQCIGSQRVKHDQACMHRSPGFPVRPDKPRGLTAMAWWLWLQSLAFFPTRSNKQKLLLLVHFRDQVREQHFINMDPSCSPSNGFSWLSGPHACVLSCFNHDLLWLLSSVT